MNNGLIIPFLVICFFSQLVIVNSGFARDESRERKVNLDSGILPQNILHPSWIVLHLKINNGTENALCIRSSEIPEFSTSYRYLFEIFDAVSEERLRFTNPVASSPWRPDDNYVIIPPGKDREVFIFLHDRYEFREGERIYKFSYKFPGFYCDIFQYGYPESVDREIYNRFILWLDTGEIQFRFNKLNGKFEELR